MIRSPTDSRYNAIFNDVVSAMKPKTFFRCIASLLYSILVLYRENFALIAYYLLDGILKYASRISSKVVPLREQVHAVLLLYTSGESFRAFSESGVPCTFCELFIATTCAKCWPQNNIFVDVNIACYLGFYVIK